MTTAHARASGLEPIGPLPWGAHFCEFYRDPEDLLDTLVPFFAAGLRDDEYCIWVTSDVLSRADAEARLAAVVPDLAWRLERGQLEFHEHAEWYARAGARLGGVLQQWIDKEREGLARGFAGLRLTGDTSFVARSGWDDFVEYERTVNETFGRFRLIGLCTYHIDRCSARDVLDVMRNHQFALARRRGEWELLEHASLKIAKAELERRVDERTSALETALRSRDEFLAMLAHELRNPLAPIRNAAEILRLLAGGDVRLQKLGALLER